jgi:hypothetical protein
MRKNGRNNIGKERLIMIASSAFVMAALTMTGVYVKEQKQEKNDGYTLDFNSLENDLSDKVEEIGQSRKQQGRTEASDVSESTGRKLAANPVTEDDLDYDPLSEVGSSLVEIPGLTDQKAIEKEKIVEENKIEVSKNEEAQEELQASIKEDQESKEENLAEAEPEAGQKTASVNGGSVENGRNLNFSMEQGLIRPVDGEVLMHYSMDSSVYFATLDQYKYNPAVLFGAPEDAPVSACAQGLVLSVFSNEEIGNAVTLDLGNGYQATYGQLKDIQVSEGSLIEAGTLLGYVAAPTKYYSLEGSNLYFALTCNNTPVNPGF